VLRLTRIAGLPRTAPRRALPGKALPGKALPGKAAGIVAADCLAAAAVAGCARASAAPTSSISVTSAYVQVPSAPGKTTVGYLDIRNDGAGSDRLLSVTTSVGGSVVMRAPVQPGVSPVVMETVATIPVPPDAMTQLVPNNYHLLITGEGQLVDGKDIMLKLKFAHAGLITILALVTNPENGGSSYFLN
jgi:copper(I)-binding protein